MLSGFLLGLVSAAANGSTSILGAIAVRRVGVLVAPLTVLTIALVFMGAFAWLSALPFAFGSDDLPLLLLLGIIVAISFGLSYKALQLGPVSVVSSIMATSGAASVVFAVLLLSEHPTPLQWMAVPVSTVGAVLATRAPRLAGSAPAAAIGMGPVYAAVTVLIGGWANALIRIPIVEHGPVQAVVVQRFFTVIFIALLAAGAALLGRRTRRRARAHGERAHPHGETLPLAPKADVRRGGLGGWQGTVALLTLMGAIDGAGFIAFAFGMAVAPAWLLGLVSQSGRLVAACVATAIFRETLAPTQWAGIALVGVGLVLAVVPT